MVILVFLHLCNESVLWQDRAGFNGDAWQMRDTVLQEVNELVASVNAKRKRKRRSFDELDYNDPADRDIFRQNVPLFSKYILSVRA